MIIRNAAILQGIFLVNVARHVQLPLSNLHGSSTSLLKFPAFLQGGITADKPPAVFWHRRNGPTAKTGASTASHLCGKLFGERQNDLVARPSTAELEGKSVALLDASDPEMLSAEELNSRLRFVYQAADSHGPIVSPAEFIVSRSTECMGVEQKLASFEDGRLLRNTSFTPGISAPSKTFRLLNGQGWYIVLLQLLVFLVDLSLADVYIAWISERLHPQRKEESQKFLSLISTLQDMVFKDSFDIFALILIHSREFLSPLTNLKYLLSDNATIHILVNVLRLVYEDLLSRLKVLLHIIKSDFKFSSLSTVYTMGSSQSILKPATLCRLWYSCICNTFRTPKMPRWSVLPSHDSRTRFKHVIMANLLFWRNVSFTEYGILLGRLCDKVSHSFIITATTLGPLRRCYVFLFHSIRVLWEILSSSLASVRLHTARPPLQRTESDIAVFERRDYASSDYTLLLPTWYNNFGKLSGRFSTYMPPSRRPGTKGYAEIIGQKARSPAQLTAWQEELDFGSPVNHSTPNPVNFPLSASPFSTQLDEFAYGSPTGFSPWRPNRYRESSNSFGIGRPRSLQFLRDPNIPISEADMAPSWRRGDSASSMEEANLNRRASADFQALKRRAQCKTFIGLLPSFLADDPKKTTPVRTDARAGNSSSTIEKIRGSDENSEYATLEEAIELQGREIDDVVEEIRGNTPFREIPSSPNKMTPEKEVNPPFFPVSEGNPVLNSDSTVTVVEASSKRM